jgi:olefin beta-lactone synthetase
VAPDDLSARPDPPAPLDPPGGREAAAAAPAAGGAPLVTANLSEHLTRVAARLPDRQAVVCLTGAGSRVRATSRTFRDLDRAADRLAHAFAARGIGKGVRTILMVRPSFELFAVMFALLRTGAVPVMIDPGMGRQKLVDNLSSVEAEAYIGIPLAQALRVASRGRFTTVETSVTVGRRLFWGGPTLLELLESEPWRPFTPAPSRPDDVAAIFFTSGSTGPPKGVVYEHGMFDTMAGFLHRHFDYQEGDVDLATFPIFSLLDVVLGITSVIPDMDPTKPGKADPAMIAEAVTTQRCTSMYASPALLDNLARWGAETGTALPTLKRIVTAGAPARPDLLERLQGMLPDGAVISTPYGATEVLPVSTIDSHEILTETRPLTEAGAGTCVGRPLDGVDVAIIGIREEAIGSWDEAEQLPCGQTGEIAVHGANVTREYFRRPDATLLAKIPVEPGSADVWHRMGDVGRLDEQGRLWFCGRMAHRVETVHGTLFSIPCEAIFNAHPRVRRAALVGVGPRGTQRPVIVVELKQGDGGEDLARLTAELLVLGAARAHTAGIRDVLYHSGFPVDVRHNAKIRREDLAAWAARELGGA